LPIDRVTLGKRIEELVRDIHEGVIKPTDILRTYGKLALKAHEKTNCLTEVMISEAEQWAEDVNLKGPLAGIPVSLKDTLIVGGFDVTVGYSAHAGKLAAHDGALVRILKDAGQNCLP
jgi:Asp-tRNA(Asn)/Glu-tRNA(Gln) amidotransferase A subunit family amidase